jgi:TRAP-type transport system periplasmic protein
MQLIYFIKIAVSYKMHKHHVRAKLLTRKGSDMERNANGKYLFVVLVVVSIFLVGTAMAGIAEAKVVLKFANVASNEDLQQNASNFFAKKVAERTNGEVEVRLYPSGQLGGGTLDHVEAVRMGSIDLFTEDFSWYSVYNTNFSILNVPFMIKGQDNLQKVLDGPIGKSLENSLHEHNLIVLAHNWVYAPRVVVSKAMAKSPADLQGIKLRVPEMEAYLVAWNAMGVKATPIAWTELLFALKQGVVDAAEPPYDAAYTERFFEAAPYIIMTRHLETTASVVMNKKKYDSLSPKIQKILLETAREAGIYKQNLMKEEMKLYGQKMVDGGAQIIEVDPVPFMEKVKDVGYVLENKGRWEKGLVDKIKAAQN